MTNKPVATKFTGELLEPILVPFEVPRYDASGKLLINLSGFSERIKKMAALARHYEVADGNKINGDLLAYKMACDLVPGFKVLIDDPIARAINSEFLGTLPDVYYGKGTKLKGSGAFPEWLNGILLIFSFEVFAFKYPKEAEVALAERVVLTFKPELKGEQHKKAREKHGKTLRNRLSKARKQASTKT